MSQSKLLTTDIAKLKCLMYLWVIFTVKTLNQNKAHLLHKNYLKLFDYLIWKAQNYLLFERPEIICLLTPLNGSSQFEIRMGFLMASFGGDHNHGSWTSSKIEHNMGWGLLLSQNVLKSDRNSDLASLIKNFSPNPHSKQCTC